MVFEGSCRLTVCFHIRRHPLFFIQQDNSLDINYLFTEWAGGWSHQQTTPSILNADPPFVHKQATILGQQPFSRTGIGVTHHSKTSHW